jgi:hypothetical protein
MNPEGLEAKFFREMREFSGLSPTYVWVESNRDSIQSETLTLSFIAHLFLSGDCE